MIVLYAALSPSPFYTFHIATARLNLQPASVPERKEEDIT